MDLLPNTSEEFSSESYWDKFFTNLKDDAFEWYGEYPELAELLHKYVSVKDNVLITGCGNSTLSFCLHKAGIVNQTNIDISSVVVSQMTKAYPDLKFLQEDVTNMSNFDADSFSCVLDKGTFDALTPPPSKAQDGKIIEKDEEKTKSDLMLEEINRVLKQGGRFVCISLLQPHVADKLFSYFHKAGWMIRVVRCSTVEEKALKASSDRVVFPCFLNVFTKVKLPPSIKPVIEASCGSSFIRVKELDELLSYIVNQQNMMQLRRELMNIGVAATKEVVLRLVSKEGEDRFVFYVTDAMKLIKNPVENRFGVFIVPQGREPEWLFGTHEGRIQLAQESNFTRLVVVHFVRGQTYESMAKVQEEIAGHIQFMMPRSVSERNIRAPIMTISSDVGTRSIRYSGKSEFSGEFVVEDVLGDANQYSRRLIFLNNPNVIQSEVGLSITKKKGKELTVLKRALACEHHQIMSIAFGIIQKFFKYDGPVSSVLVGLGGGLLASFLVDFIPNIKLTAVEIDDAIVKVAKDYFGLPKQDERLNVVVEDGLKFLQNTGSQFNVILFDVDNKSVTEGLSCPPPAFIEKGFLEQVKSKLSPDAGVLVVNLVCRNPKLKEKHMEEIASVFPAVYSYQVGSDLNNILFCFNNLPGVTLKQWNSTLKASIEWLDNVITTTTKSSKDKKKSAAGGGNYEWTKDQMDEVFDADIDFIRDRFKLMKTGNS